jgi:hypothetical protein
MLEKTFQVVTETFCRESLNIVKLKSDIHEAKSYEMWYKAALIYDRLCNKEIWKLTMEDRDYDYKLILFKLEKLYEARIKEDIQVLLTVLQEGFSRGLGGINNTSLYTKCCVGTKNLIEDYVKEVSKAIKFLSKCEASYFYPREKDIIFSNMLQAFGRTALYLSGGGPFGFYHFGVVSCLLEERLLPQVLCGTATGALVAALLAVHSSEEMGLLLKSEALCLAPYYLFDDKCSIKKKLVKFLTQDHVVNIEELKEFCIQHLGQFTFEEAYQKTGRAVNIVALPRATWEVPLLLNHLTSPHVLLWSAVLSSCSLFELCPAGFSKFHT